MKNFEVLTSVWGEVKKTPSWDIAILPWGATEPHNGHLPYGTDVLSTRAISLDVAEKVSDRGVNLMVLPFVPFGSQNPGQSQLPFCLHTSQHTQFCILTDIVKSLRRQGINKLLIINGHGGNGFKGMIRDLCQEYPDFTVISSNWFDFIPNSLAFEEKVDDHAGEQETSVIMHYYPELVKMEYASDGTPHPFAVQGLNEKVAWIPRNWSKATYDTGIGNPSKASAEKGRKYAEAVVAKYVDLVEGLVKTGPDKYL